MVTPVDQQGVVGYNGLQPLPTCESKMTYETEQRIVSLKAFYSGLREGVVRFAHWKDGVQYVGTTGKSLLVAIREINKEEEEGIERIKRNYP